VPSTEIASSVALEDVSAVLVVLSGEGDAVVELTLRRYFDNAAKCRVLSDGEWERATVNSEFMVVSTGRTKDICYGRMNDE